MVWLEPFSLKVQGKLRGDDPRVLVSVKFINHNGLRCRDAAKKSGPHETLCAR